MDRYAAVSAMIALALRMPWRIHYPPPKPQEFGQVPTSLSSKRLVRAASLAAQNRGEENLSHEVLPCQPTNTPRCTSPKLKHR